MKNLKNLYEIQNELQNSVKNRSFSKALSQIILEKPPISINERLKIYQNAYEKRMMESLKDDFTHLSKILDENEFTNLIKEYIAAHPSRSRNLAEYSQNFPYFARKKSEKYFEEASKDWMTIVSNYRSNPDPGRILSAEQVQSGIPFLLKNHPSVFIQKINLKNYASYRQGGEINILEISIEDYKIIDFLKEGQSIDMITSRLQQLEISESKLSECLSNLIKSEIIYCERI